MYKNIDLEDLNNSKCLMLYIVLEDLVKSHKDRFYLEASAYNRIIDNMFGESNSFNNALNAKSLSLIEKKIKESPDKYIDEEFAFAHMEHFFCGGNAYGEDPRCIGTLGESYFENYLKEYISGEVDYSKIVNNYVDERQGYVKAKEPFVTSFFIEYLSENHNIDFDGLKIYVSKENIEEYESLGIEVGLLKDIKKTKKKNKIKP